MTRDGHEWTLTGWVWLSIGSMEGGTGYEVWREVAKRNGWDEDIQKSRRRYDLFKKALAGLELDGRVEIVKKGRSRASSTWTQTEKGAAWWVREGKEGERPQQGSTSMPRVGKWLTRVSSDEWDTIRRMVQRGEMRVAVKLVEREDDDG